MSRASGHLQMFSNPKIPRAINLRPKLNTETVELYFNVESSSFMAESLSQPTTEMSRMANDKEQTEQDMSVSCGLHSSGLALSRGLGCSSGS